MKLGTLALAALVVPGWVGPVAADGMLLGPSKWLASFSEQMQLAVVEVRPDETVEVDLFISLLDESGESREVHFLLPLQTMPGEFRAAERSLAEFRKEEVEPLDELFREAAAAQQRHQRAVEAAFAVGSLPAGPFAAAAQWHTILGGRHRGMLASGQAEFSLVPVLSVATEHARADVYDSLSREELAELANLPGLPAIVSDSLSGYVGRPFALVRLQTQPRADVARDIGWIAPEEHPGLHFAFTQDLVIRDGARCYDYPLGTGQAWEHPIPLTQVCVTAPDDMILEVEFPDRTRGRVETGAKWGRLGKGKSLAYAADGRQVHMATYDHSNPKEDVRVVLRGRGKNELGAAEQRRRRQRMAAWLVFPLLGVAAWLLPFRLLVWPDRESRKSRVGPALVMSLATAYAVLLLPALVVVLASSHLGYSVRPLAELLRDITYDMRGLFSFWVLVLVGAAALAALAARAWRRLPGQVTCLVRIAVAAGLAGAVYFLVGASIALWLAG